MFWWLWHGAVLVRWIQTLWMHLFPHFQGSRHVLQQTPSILGCYTISMCKYRHCTSFDQISFRKFLFKLIYRNVIKVSFQTKLLYFSAETSIRLFCKGKILNFKIFDLMDGVYFTPFHIFHLQPIWLTIRYSKCNLFVSQAVPAANWYSDALKCLHCHGQSFSSVTISQSQQQNIQEDQKLQQQQCEKLKNWDCCIHLQDYTVSKYKRMQMDTAARQQCKKPSQLPQDFKKIFYYTFKKDHFMKDSDKVDQHFCKWHYVCCCGMPSVPKSTGNTKAHKHSHWSTLHAQSTAQNWLWSTLSFLSSL